MLEAFAVPGRVARELLGRYGDEFTRAGLYTPYQLSEDVGQAIVRQLQAG
jgi:hypothetical protein